MNCARRSASCAAALLSRSRVLFAKLKPLDGLFVGWAFFLQTVLVVHFALRKPFFENYTLKYGWLVYAHCIPGLVISVILLIGKMPWYFWLGGILFTAFAIFGYYIDYVKSISWRSPIIAHIMAPYVTLYLASIMFYWWPLARIDRRLWFIFSILFVIGTVLNITSH